MTDVCLEAEVTQVSCWGMTEPVLTFAYVPDWGTEDED